MANPLSKEEKFKIFLIQHDMYDQLMIEAVRLCPELLEIYDVESLAFITTYLSPQLKPEQFSPKFRPIVYNALRLKAMKQSKTIIDCLNEIISNDEECKKIIAMELKTQAAIYQKKIES